MPTITIQGLPLTTSVVDTTYIPTETAGITQAAQLITLKNYMTTLPNLVVPLTGTITGTLATASQPAINSVGVLLAVTTSGPITSTVADGTAPLVIGSKTLVPNLYVEHATLADLTTNGLTIGSTFANALPSDATIGGCSSNLTMVLNTVNASVGTWGGNVGLTYLIPQITVNSKGLITSASNIAVDLDLPHRTVTNLNGTANQINVSSPVGTSYVSLTDPIQVGNVYASGNIAGLTVYDNGRRVLTSVTAIAGNGIVVSGQTTATQAALTITNTGVTSLAASTGISLNATTGNIAITNTGVTSITGTQGITTSATTGGVTAYPTYGFNGYGHRYISTATPTGGSDGDIWYQV